jgi:hypothetical protein
VIDKILRKFALVSVHVVSQVRGPNSHSIDVLACPHWRARLRLIATLHDPAVIRKILAHLGRSPSNRAPVPPSPRQVRPEVISRARRPPSGLHREHHLG